ncbi:MAG: hypothetical protein ACOCWG_01160 [bacterium]
MEINNLSLHFSRLIKIFKRNRSGASYVSLTIATTLIRFIKGFVLMKYLSLEDLGIITLIMAVMGLFSMLQIGFLNGGYRIYSENHKDSKDVNNIIYSYFSIIISVIIFGIILMGFLGKLNVTELVFALLASFFGVLLVLNNWKRSVLISQKRISEVNKLKIAAIIVSFVFLFTVPVWGLYGAILVTFSIELVFYILAVWRTPDLLPTGFNFRFKQYKWVLSYGFLPFLSGVIIAYNMQLETWSIASFLSTEALGRFYLPRLYASLFLLIPVAVNQIFYPDVIKAYTKNDFSTVKRTIKNYFIVNGAVSFFILIITLLFIEKIIGIFVPKHLVGIPYVWLILPGLIIYSMRVPLDLLFYASNILRPFLWSAIVGVCFTTIFLISAGFLEKLSLEYVSIVKSMFYLIITCSLLLFYYKKKEIIWAKKN